MTDGPVPPDWREPAAEYAAVADDNLRKLRDVLDRLGGWFAQDSAHISRTIGVLHKCRERLRKPMPLPAEAATPAGPKKK